MARFAKKDVYRLGDYYLAQRSGSPFWYRCWVEDGKPKRVSLGTDDLVEAKTIFNEWFRLNVRPESASLNDVPLADVLDAYWTHHSCKLPSKGAQKVAYNVWKAFFEGETVSAATKPQRQAAFRAELLTRMKPSSAGRVRRHDKLPP